VGRSSALLVTGDEQQFCLNRADNGARTS
jgi:hypothetical protein